MVGNQNDLEVLVKEFFEILDRQETSDGGNVFRPTYISSCRVMEMKKLEELLPKLKKAVGL